MISLSALKLPELELRVDHALLDVLRRATYARCERLGLFGEEGMSRRKFEAGRFELLSALCYPDTDVDALGTINDFMTYLFYVDDRADENASFGQNPALLRSYFEGHVQTLRGTLLPDAKDPAGRLLLSIRERLGARASAAWLSRFAADVEDYLLRGTMTSSLHWTFGTVPQLAEYARHRLLDSAVLCAQDLIELAPGAELPEWLVCGADMTELRRLCTQVAAYTNDLVSYAKEVRQHACPSNLLHVILTHESCSFDEAVARVVDLINEDCATFERLAGELMQRARLLRAPLARYLTAQRAWMTGSLLWSLQSGRYVDQHSPFVELRGTVSLVRAVQSVTSAA
jgi:hypothetical protein